MRTAAPLFLLGLLVLGLPDGVRAQAVINEVQVGTPDFIEVLNCGTAPLDLSGWSVLSWYATSGGVTPTAEPAFTLPSGTTIPPGGTLVLQEFGTAGSPGSLPSSLSVGFNYFWVANRTLEIALVDAGGQGVDYLYRDVFGNGTHPHLPPGTSWSGRLADGSSETLYRDGDIDTDDVLDWAADSSLPTAGALNPGQVAPSCGGSSPLRPFQVNAPEARMDLDGTGSNGLTPAVTTVPMCGTSLLTVDSSLPTTAFEIAFNRTALVPRGSPNSLSSLAGQVLNVNVFSSSTAYLVGGTTVGFRSFTGRWQVPLSISGPGTVSGQAAFQDPTHPEGLRFTQAVQLDVVSGMTSLPGPTTDDGTVLVDLNNLCGPVDALGTTFATLGVSANGRLTFGGTDGDFSPSPLEARLGYPFLGYWTDFDPSLGGTITISEQANVLRVDWIGVPYFGEPNTASSFTISYDRAGRVWSLDNLQGIVPNPRGTNGPGDSIFFGLSPGLPATDPGPLVFTVGQSGAPLLQTDMIYEWFDAGTGNPNRAALSAGLRQGLVGVRFVPLSTGGVLWAGF